MENSLRITTVQSVLHWENARANLAMFTEKLQGLAGQTDLVILPEMFTTGFSMNAGAISETMEGPSVKWMKEMASSLHAVVTGSLVIQEAGQYHNRLIWMRPDGSFSHYDKRHLFSLAGEHEHYAAGCEKLIVEWKGWKICPLICYDLRFPVWCRNTEGYDLLIFVANWPETRAHHWRQLLVARAIENQAFVAGVNRVGEDGLGYLYNGDSAIVDYAGNLLCQAAQVEGVFTVALQPGKLKEFRTKLQFLADRDDFEILF